MQAGVFPYTLTLPVRIRARFGEVGVRVYGETTLFRLDVSIVRVSCTAQRVLLLGLLVASRRAYCILLWQCQTLKRSCLA